MMRWGGYQSHTRRSMAHPTYPFIYLMPGELPTFARLCSLRDLDLKLIGARNTVIGGLILQQSLLMGAFGYVLAWWIGRYAFPYFPRLVLIDPSDLASLALIVVVISTLASLLGIWKALRVEANTVLAV